MPLTLSLDELRARPSVEVVATMECAGNGRAGLAPHVDSQPWLHEAVGTGAWRGVRLRDVLDEAGVRDGAVEVVFTGLDRGLEEEVEQNYQRSLPLSEAMRDEVLLAYELNGVPLPPQHGFPLRLLVPGWYGMTSVKWLARIDVVDRPFEGFQMAKRYRLQRDEDDEGEPLTRMAPHALAVPPGVPDFHSRERFLDAGPVRAARSRLVGVGAGGGGRGERRRRRDVGAGARRARRRLAVGMVGVDVRVGRAARPPRALRSARATKPGTSSRSRASGTSAATPTTPSSASSSTFLTGHAPSPGLGACPAPGDDGSDGGLTLRTSSRPASARRRARPARP